MVKSPLNSIEEQEWLQAPRIQSPDFQTTLLMGDMIDSFLAFMEHRFESDESSLSSEEMSYYILSATYMAARYQRKNIVKRVREVYEALPF